MDFDNPAFWPRVNRYEGREIERALAGVSRPSLLDPGVRLAGAVVEAAYIGSDPPVADRFAEIGIDYLVDAQALRFTTETFLGIESLARLPFAPSVPLTPVAEPSDLVEASLRFQEREKAGAYVVPAVATPDFKDGWHKLNVKIHHLAARMNGTAVQRKPLVAMCAPGWQALKDPTRLVSPLADLPIDAVYVQPTRLRPTRDGVEKLVRYCRLVAAAQDGGITVVAGRVGAFGVVLQALGVCVFDSGLGEAESFDLGSLNRPRRPSNSKGGGGRNRRVYLPGLMTTLRSEESEAILAQSGLRHRFACELPCCRFGTVDQLSDRRRQHYLHVRTSEMENIRRLPTREMRVEHVRSLLLEARSNAAAIRRVFSERGLVAPSFSHIDQWLAVVSRIDEIPRAA